MHLKSVNMNALSVNTLRLWGVSTLIISEQCALFQYLMYCNYKWYRFLMLWVVVIFQRTVVWCGSSFLSSTFLSSLLLCFPWAVLSITSSSEEISLASVAKYYTLRSVAERKRKKKLTVSQVTTSGEMNYTAPVVTTSEIGLYSNEFS